MAKKNVLREIFSGTNGKLSSKRVIGGIAMAVVLVCTSYLVIRDGSTDVVENLLMTIFITSASLLGLPAVTGIWNKSKLTVGDVKESDDELPVEEPKKEEPTTPISDCENCYYKQLVNKKHKGAQ